MSLMLQSKLTADHYKKTFVRYGDPTAWDPTDKFNAGLREVDADLFPEFSSRVETWRKGVTELEVNRLIDHHGTLNAAIRHLVSTKSL